MNTQIKEIKRLALELKKEAQKHYLPDCGHEKVTKKVNIYFANGYNTFSAYSNKDGSTEITYSEYSNEIQLKCFNPEKAINEAIVNFTDAIEYLRAKETSDLEEQKEAKRQLLLKQLEDLK